MNVARVNKPSYRILVKCKNKNVMTIVTDFLSQRKISHEVEQV